MSSWNDCPLCNAPMTLLLAGDDSGALQKIGCLSRHYYVSYYPIPGFEHVYETVRLGNFHIIRSTAYDRKDWHVYNLGGDGKDPTNRAFLCYLSVLPISKALSLPRLRKLMLLA